jgi:hypothetical protein
LVAIGGGGGGSVCARSQLAGRCNDKRRAGAYDSIQAVIKVMWTTIYGCKKMIFF